MRITHFRQRMDDEFGPARAAALAHDHVFADLGGHTVDGALAAGTDPKHIWATVCTTFNIPESRR